MIVGPHPTKLPQSWDTGFDQPSLLAISISAVSIFSNGTWLTREPPCRFFFKLFQTKSYQIQTLSFPFDVASLPVRFSQSEFPMSIEEGRAASERFDSSSRDVERLPSHNFSLWVIQFLLSGFSEVFLHVRCKFHIRIRKNISEQVCVNAWKVCLCHNIPCNCFFCFCVFFLSNLFFGKHFSV